MKENTNAIVVFKIGQREHMCSFLKEGLLYMNCVDYFRQSSNCDQGDIFEGADIVNKGNVVSYRSTIMHEKIFCLWHLNDRDSPIVDKCKPHGNGEWELTIETNKFKGFTHANLNDSAIVVIQNIKEFHTRLRNELNKHFAGRYKSDAVTYYNVDTADFLHVNVFMKPDIYEEQSELRYLVFDDENNSGKPLKIRIGDISDIASLFPMSHISIVAEEK